MRGAGREAGHAQVGGAAAPALEQVEMGDFVVGGREADLEALDFAEPAMFPDFVDPGQETVADFG